MELGRVVELALEVLLIILLINLLVIVAASINLEKEGNDKFSKKVHYHSTYRVNNIHQDFFIN